MEERQESKDGLVERQISRARIELPPSTRSILLSLRESHARSQSLLQELADDYSRSPNGVSPHGEDVPYSPVSCPSKFSDSPNFRRSFTERFQVKVPSSSDLNLHTEKEAPTNANKEIDDDLGIRASNVNLVESDNGVDHHDSELPVEKRGTNVSSTCDSQETTKRASRQSNRNQIFDAIHSANFETENMKQVMSGKLIRPDWIIRFCQRIIKNRYFEWFMGLVILFNSVIMGVETDMRINGNVAVWIDHLEHAFIILYIIELALRYGSDGSAILKDNWILFDIALIMIACFTGYLLPMFLNGDHPFTVLRAFRLLRFARALRMVKSMGVMWKLVVGILKSWNTMLSTLGLVLLSLFIFACMGVELITQDPELQEVLGDDYMFLFYGSVPRIMLTLLNFVTLDSISGIYRPIVNKKPLLMFYFVPLLLVISISLMNLVTAVLVENAMEMAASDQAEKKQTLKKQVSELIPKLEKVFDSIDANGDGVLTMEELLDLDTDKLPEEFHDVLMNGSLEELFMMLDLDRSGEVEKEEFIEGILSVLFASVPREVLVVLKISRLLLEKMAKFEESLQSLERRDCMLRL